MEYGIWLKKYLQIHPLKYSKMTIGCSLMEYLENEEEYLYNYSEIVRLYIKTTLPEPQTHEFIVIAKYNQIMKVL